MTEITLDVAVQSKQECARYRSPEDISWQRKLCSKSWSCDRTWDIRGVTHTIGDVSLPASIGNSRVLVVPKSQTQGTFIKNNTVLTGTLYFN